MRHETPDNGDSSRVELVHVTFSCSGNRKQGNRRPEKQQLLYRARLARVQPVVGFCMWSQYIDENSTTAMIETSATEET
jgi:hypothetical protein